MLASTRRRRICSYSGSIEEFCARINKEKKVDVLVNNAGLMMPKYTGTKQGFEVILTY